MKIIQVNLGFSNRYSGGLTFQKIFFPGYDKTHKRFSGKFSPGSFSLHISWKIVKNRFMEWNALWHISLVVCNNLVFCAKDLQLDHHDQFVPLAQFGVDSLPDLPENLPLKKEDIVRYVQTLAPLVVRVHGKFISTERPEVWGDGSPYPFAELRGKSVDNVGTGWVDTVWDTYRFTSECSLCKKQVPGRCWKIEVYTSRHVVFNLHEASLCEVVCFDDTPAGAGTESLHGGDIYDAATQDDFSQIACYTHDTELATRLQQLIQKREELFEKFHPFERDYEEVEGRPLAIVISHPHGRMKYVSVGEMREKVFAGEDEDGESWFVTYTAPTCAGSSGGLVLPLGKFDDEDGKWTWNSGGFAYPHCGTRAGNLAVGHSACLYSPL